MLTLLILLYLALDIDLSFALLQFVAQPVYVTGSFGVEFLASHLTYVNLNKNGQQDETTGNLNITKTSLFQMFSVC